MNDDELVFFVSIIITSIVCFVLFIFMSPLISCIIKENSSESESELEVASSSTAYVEEVESDDNTLESTVYDFNNYETDEYGYVKN